MKKKISSFLFLITLSVTVTFGQSLHSGTPSTYFGIGTGFNATGLVGLTLEHIFIERFGVYANAGLGSWGYKLGGGGRFYFKDAYSGAIGINLSHCTGADGVKSELKVVNKAGQTVTETIEYNAHPVDVLNLSYLKFWPLGQKARFNIEAGYSIPLNGKSTDNYTIVTPGYTLDESSEKTLIAIQPGGLILAVGFTFGF